MLDTRGSHVTPGLPTCTKKETFPPSEALSMRSRYSSFLAMMMRD